jgi:hypothetical protein
MNKILLVFLAITAMYSCEKDDFCVEANTPKLIIRYLDFADQANFKSVTLDFIYANDLGSYTESVGISTDSIAIPLDFLNNQTTYYFQKENESAEEINFTYTRENIFVSRSCGFKVNYKDLNLTQITNHWIQKITIENPSITDEQNAHLYIYH